MSYALENVREKFELKNRNYVVTGGAQGIGFAVARAICEMGGNIALLDIKDKPIDEYNTLSTKFGTQTTYIQTDVSKEESLTASFQQAIGFLGSIDGCVTAAGIAIDKPFVEQQWKEVQRIQEINVLGTFFAAQLAAKEMQKQETPGSIVLIASISSHIALPGYKMAAYNASKGGVRILSTALAVELAPKRIRVNSISPGFIDSEQTRVIRDLKSVNESAVMDTAPPLKRIGTQNDLTGAVVYLLSDASSYTTAADIPITGGLHAGRMEM